MDYHTLFQIISLRYLYLLETVSYFVVFAIYLQIYSIFTPILNQDFQFSDIVKISWHIYFKDITDYATSSKSS